MHRDFIEMPKVKVWTSGALSLSGKSEVQCQDSGQNFRGFLAPLEQSRLTASSEAPKTPLKRTNWTMPAMPTMPALGLIRISDRSPLTRCGASRTAWMDDRVSVRQGHTATHANSDASTA